MKKKTLKSLVSVGLATCMLAGCGTTTQPAATTAAPAETTAAATTEAPAETTAAASEYPEYLNMDSFRPIVKEGEEVTLKFAVRRPSSAPDTIENNWFPKYIEEVLNIDIELIEITSDTLAEKKNLMFASGDLPDMMFDLNVTNAEIVQYGVEDELFLPISDYFSEELTPNMLDTIEKYPDALTVSKASNGKLYTLASAENNATGRGSNLGETRVYFDMKILEKIGVTEVPDTLDGFIDLCRKLKAADPDSYPIIEASIYLDQYLLSAFGFTVTPSGLTNEGALMPVWDEQEDVLAVPALNDKYVEYLKVMNTLYTEGLIHPDYFTMDQLTARSYFTERKAAVMCDDTPYISVPEGWEDYICAKPLASEWIDTGITTTGNATMKGDIFISADTEYPELCLRFMDYLFSPEGSAYSRYGPLASDEEALLGKLGFKAADENTMAWQDSAASNYGSNWEHDLAEMMMFFIDINVPDRIKFCEENTGFVWPLTLKPTDPDNHARITNYENQKDGFVDKLPETYMTADQITTYTDLLTVLKNYVDQETAKFTVGQRPLDEADEFIAEVKAMGGDDWMALMQELYANYER